MGFLAAQWVFVYVIFCNFLHLSQFSITSVLKCLVTVFSPRSRTWMSSSFSLKIGRLSLCCTMDSSVFLPYDTWFPPNAYLFHAGRSTGIAPMPLMLAAICLPSSAWERNKEMSSSCKLYHNPLFYLIKMNCNDSELPNELFFY